MARKRRIKAGVFGGTGWRGVELVSILAHHPHVSLQFVTSVEHPGSRLGDVYPQAPDVPLIEVDAADLDGIDVAFFALPHVVAAPLVIAAIDAGVRVVDMSADFRIKDAALYGGWYGVDHQAPALLQEAVYGLTEFVRPQLGEARLVSVPGAYATSALIPLQPLLAADAVNGTTVIDTKGGVSNAGRFPSITVDYMELADNLVPYDVGRHHRHLPEMEQFMGWHHPDPPSLIFAPHLMPIPRGVLSTLYVPIKHHLSEDDVRGFYQDAFAGEPFIQLLPEDRPATIAHARGTNRCVLGLTMTRNAIVVTSALDNLRKGSSGQAVQNMNVMFGLAETAGLG